MEMHDYIVENIRGEYADLRRLDDPGAELLPVAMALLPPETDLGTKLRGMMGMFTILD